MLVLDTFGKNTGFLGNPGKPLFAYLRLTSLTRASAMPRPTTVAVIGRMLFTNVDALETIVVASAKPAAAA